VSQDASRTSLLCADQRRRWRLGEPVPVEDYLRDHPALGQDDEALLDLIYNEMVLRDEHGNPPRLQEYLTRFGHLEEPLRLLFEVHDAIEHPRSTQVVQVGDFIPSSGEETSSRPEAGALPGVPGYEILDVLGAGGMGVVYRARQLSLGRLVALKMLRGVLGASAASLARFEGEARLAAGLQHPNIVAVHEVGKHQGMPFFAMELVEGGPLPAHTRGVPQPAREAAALVAALGRAVQHAHEHGVIHRDLKPANILLHETCPRGSGASGQGPAGDDKDGLRPPVSTPSGAHLCLGGGSFLPKITDFGLAKHAGAPDAQTRTGDVLGTPSYMSPEQAAGKGPEVGPRTDVYGLGTVLYELLTGRPPFKAETATDTLLQVLHRDPVPPSRLRARTPRDLETICLKCLEKEPRARYATARDLAEDLERFVAGVPIRARRSAPWERAWKWARRRPAMATLVGVSALAVLGLAVAFAGHRQAEQRRLAGVRAELQDYLALGRDALLKHQWPLAEHHMGEVLARAGAEPTLGDLVAQAEPLLNEARLRRAEQDAKQRAADLVLRFRRLRDEALFHGMNSLIPRHELPDRGALYTGMDRESHRAATEKAARAALALAGVAVERDAPWIPGREMADPARRGEVAAGCYALLLVLADAVAEGPGPSRQARYRQALRVVERVPAVHAPTAAYHLRRDYYRDRLGEPVSAGRTPAPAAALDHFLIGYDHFRHHRLPEARRSFEAAVALDAGHFWAQYYLAACRLFQRQLEAAAASLNACVWQRPEFVWSYLLRGFAWGETQSWDAAEADFARAEGLLRNEPNPEAQYVLHASRGFMRLRHAELEASDQSLRARYLGEAAADLERAIALQPHYYMAHANLARLHRLRGQAAEAAAEFRQAQRRGAPPFVPAGYYKQQGQELCRRGDYAAAAAACRKALDYDPALAEAHGILGRALLGLGDHAGAVREYNQYLAHGGPPAPDVFGRRGEARMGLGDYLGARDDYTRALEMAPGAELYLHRGWAYFFADAYRPALRDFNDTLRLDGASADARTGRGLCHVFLGEYRPAVEDARAALRHGLQGPEMLHNVACIFAQAAGRCESDPSVSDRVARAAGYRREAVAALRGALAKVPATQRPRFWGEKMRPDPALDPIRHSPEFRKLEGELASPPAPR
jgi:serine/threonine protein kinase/Flp pilus assembly protein TadD